ncbi:hypothetical protein [Leptotrichia buccalis]|uniref:hypothetical protein n=1 Tax=Leptotrichia buccalis TaxID=40542 RepID=UPI001EF10D43|nr:hypothetical protein [Leptotrichia buccalis]
MHKEFAEIYDIFMKYVNYDGWYKFLRTFIKKKGNSSGFGMWDWGIYMEIFERWIFSYWSGFVRKNAGNF